MVKITVVRHGQASAFTDNYDRLTELGHYQATLLGHYLSDNLAEFDTVICGSLQRHQETGQRVIDAYKKDERNISEIEIIPEFNEVQISGIYEQFLQGKGLENNDDIAQLIKKFQDEQDIKIKRKYLTGFINHAFKVFIAGEHNAEMPELWVDFSNRVKNAFIEVINNADDNDNIIIFSSGGPVIALSQFAMELSDKDASEKQWNVYNTSLTEFNIEKERVELENYNRIQHLTEEQLRTLI